MTFSLIAFLRSATCVSTRICLFVISYFIIHLSSFADSVRIEAAATGLSPDEPLEFLLIGPNSSHDYEAFAQCKQSAAEIRAAMVSAGLVPGTPANPDAFLFRPRGERLRISISTANDSAGIPLETLIAPSGAMAPPPFPGFVFSGSRPVSNETTLLADAEEPYSIISTYNEAASIIDVRGDAPQQSTYGTRSLAKVGKFEKGTPLTFTIEPWFPEGGHATNVAVVVSSRGIQFGTLKTDASERRPYLPEEKIIPQLNTLTANETDVFVGISWDAGLTVHAAIRAAAMIQKAADTGWVIPEPPPTNQLYYRAFLPDPQHRDRAKRLEQPWELHLATGAIPETATAIWIEESWTNGASDATLTPHETVVRSGQELETTLTTHDGIPVILVYAKPDTTIGGIMRFLSPCLDTHSTVYVFEE